MVALDAADEHPDSPGTEAWTLMAEIWKSCKPWMEQVANSFSITPQQLLAIKVLGEYGTMAMSELAVYLGCDASNVTSLVDKLETRGLMERRSAPHDRRVKSIVLTGEGTDIYRGAKEAFRQPPPAIANLTTSDQEVLCAIFRRAIASMENAATPAAPSVR